VKAGINPLRISPFDLGSSTKEKNIDAGLNEQLEKAFKRRLVYSL
jgi:hypothetical protein